MSHEASEQVQEDIHHHAEHEGHEQHGGGHGLRWIMFAALTAALLAVMAAVGEDQSNSHLAESTHNRIKSNDTWSEFQSKSLKNYTLASEKDILKAIKAEVPASLDKKMTENASDKDSLSAQATELGVSADANMKTHEDFERATTLFHIAIAIVAIAVVAKRKEFWYMSMVGGAVGVWLFVSAFAHAPKEAPEAAAETAPAAAVSPSEHGSSAKPAAEHAPPDKSLEPKPGAAGHAPAGAPIETH